MKNRIFAAGILLFTVLIVTACGNKEKEVKILGAEMREHADAFMSGVKSGTGTTTATSTSTTTSTTP